MKTILPFAIVASVWFAPTAFAKPQIVEPASILPCGTPGVSSWKTGDSLSYRNPDLHDPSSEAGMGYVRSVRVRKTHAVELNEAYNDFPSMPFFDGYLLDQKTGKILKWIFVRDIDVKLETKLKLVASTDETITVPAGTFATKHVVYKTSDGASSMEAWCSPTVGLDGLVKQIDEQGTYVLTKINLAP